MIKESRICGSLFLYRLEEIVGVFYNPHIPAGEYYLHYWAKHATPAIAAAARLAGQSESEILSKAKMKINMAREKQRRELVDSYGNDPETLAQIEYIVSGKFLENVQNINQTITANAQPLPFQQVIGITPEALINDAENGVAASQAFITQLEQLENEILSYIGENSDFAKKYQDLVIDYFTKKKGRYSGGRFNDTQANIIDALLSHGAEGFFKKSNAAYKGDFKKLTADQGRILTAISLLKDPSNFTKYIEAIGGENPSGIIRHGDGSEYLQADKFEAITEFFTKILKWKDQGVAIAAEAASGAGAISALQKAAEGFKEMEVKLSEKTGTGTYDVKTNFSGTKTLFDRVDKNAYKRASAKRTGKSDNVLEISIDKDGGNVTLYQGLTVKNYRTINISGEGSLRSANIQIQSGTPLLTLLVREAGFSMSDIINLMQVATAFGTEGAYNNGLETIWNQTMEKAKYLALLDTLAGFTNEQDQAFFMVFNGKIFDIVDILDSLDRSTGSGISWTTIGDTNQAGLKRMTYLAMNKWVAPQGKLDYDSAETRSDMLITDVSTQMYNTKIRIKIHIAQLAALASIN